MRRNRNGFTLLELMIVLTIIGILGAAFVGLGGNLFGESKEASARAKLKSLAAMIEQYRTIEGEYPDDRLPNGVSVNATNANAEALFLALFDADYRGQKPSLEWLVNTDGDETNRDLSSLATRELFEIGDEWGNPVVYFESLHYADGQSCTVFAGMDDFFDPFEVDPLRDERTGSFHSPNSFQLRSAGADGIFDTEDDLDAHSE